MLAVDLRWWVFAHLVGVFGFLIAHGVSVAVAFRLRAEGSTTGSTPSRERIRELLQLSGSTITAMYLSLGTLVAFGILAALKEGVWSQKWPRASLGVLVVITVGMAAIARPYYRRIKEACEMRPTGSPRVSDDDLAARLRGPHPILITAIGFGGLAAILYMMVFKKPF